jgi:ParB family chromosome partitioning protein
MRNFKKRTDVSELPKIEEVSRTMTEARAALAPAQGSRPEYQLSAGQVIEAPVNQLRDNPLNARRVVSQAGLEELAASLLTRGQDTAALGYLDEQGNVCLIDGHRRLEASRIAGKETLRVEIRERPGDEQELYLRSRSANTEREAQTPLDDALSWKLLLEKKVFESQAALCRKLTLEPSFVSRTIGLAELPKSIIRMLSERPDLMNLRMLDAIKRFVDGAGEEAAQALILEIDREGLSSRDVDNRRKAAERGPIARQRSDHQTIKYEKGQAVIKRFAGQGRLVVEVSQVAEEGDVEHLANTIYDALQQVLAKSKQ